MTNENQKQMKKVSRQKTTFTLFSVLSWVFWAILGFVSLALFAIWIIFVLIIDGTIAVLGGVFGTDNPESVSQGFGVAALIVLIVSFIVLVAAILFTIFASRKRKALKLLQEDNKKNVIDVQ